MICGYSLEVPYWETSNDYWETSNEYPQYSFHGEIGKNSWIHPFIWHLYFCTHYENTPIQIYWKFYLQKTENFQIKISDIFHISAQNIDCG